MENAVRNAEHPRLTGDLPAIPEALDGVVIVPRDLILDVLTAAENVYEREGGMREELRRGVSVKEAYSKYGSL